MIEGIFAVLYVSHMGLTHCYKTVVFYIYNIVYTCSAKRYVIAQKRVGSTEVTQNGDVSVTAVK